MLFLYGFLAGSAVWMAFIVWYYLRARRRVKSIEAAIQRYQSAKNVVGAACDEVYRSH